jgi:hypothetical protein
VWITPENLKYSPSAPGTAGLNWDLSDSAFACAQSLTWRGNHSQQGTWSRRLKRESWLRHLSTRMLRPSLTSDFEAWWTSCLQATHASHSAAQETAREPMTQGICGPTSQTELPLVSQAQSSSRTSKDTLPLGCVTSCATWDEWVTEQRGECLARLKSARLTNVSASSSSGGFPTPVVGDSWTPSSEASTRREWEHGNLRGVAAANWPTPQANEIENQNKEYRSATNAYRGDKKVQPMLADACKKNWPTARARDWKDSGDQQKLAELYKRDQCLPRAVAKFGQPDPANHSTTGKNPEQWPTPRAAENDENLETWEKRRERKEKEGINLHLPLSVKVRKEDWATPNARDCGGHTITKNYPDGFNKNLVTDVAKADSWPTPLEDDASNVNPSDKRMKTLVSSTKGSGMKLNPNWVEQLMGLPAGWTQLPAHWLTG